MPAAVIAVTIVRVSGRIDVPIAVVRPRVDAAIISGIATIIRGIVPTIIRGIIATVVAIPRPVPVGA
jgi:hypothetical protein